MVVPDINNDDLDPISFWVLLLLSGGQKFTFHDLVKSMNQSKESVWEALKILQEKKFAKNEKSMFMIDFEGVVYLTRQGILASEADEDPKPKEFKNKLKPPFFSSWADLLIWLAFPLILLIPTIWAASFFTAGFNFVSVEKRVYQYGTWLIYIGLIALYVKLSYHYILETDRLVVFRRGKAIGKKGPGLVFVLPIIDHVKIVDMREKSLEIKKEPCLTRDSMLLNAGFYITWQVDEPIPSLTKVAKVEDSMSLLSAAALRTSVAQFSMEEAMERQRGLNTLIRTRIEHKAGDWGVQVNSTELRELTPPDNVMKRIENRFKAELESEAALTKSDAQVESLRRLFQVGSRIDDRTFNLKYLDTLEKIGEGASTKYIIPVEFFNLLREWIQMHGNPANGNNARNGNNPAGGLPPAGPVQ
jgi:regulator of protease activity HflC (stomatin/prohibitin superfamily)